MDELKRSLTDYLEIPYQFRTHSQHTYITSSLKQIDPILFDNNTVLLLSFFAQTVTPTIQQEVIRTNSIILSKNMTEKEFKITKVVIQDFLRNFCLDQEVILLRAIDLQKCQLLKGKNIEAEVKLIQSWPFFCQIQKKKLYDIFRYCRIVSLSINQKFYNQADRIQNQYFLVRQGQFSFLYRDPLARKNVELLSVRRGFLFNQDANKSEEEIIQQGQITEKKLALPKFNYTVKCKSSHAVIYCINSDFVDKLVANVCEDQLKQHLQKKLAYLQERAQNVQKRRSSTANLLSQPPPRVHSVQLLPFTAPIRSFSRQMSKRHEQIIILNINDKSYNYKVVRQSMPKRDKLFTKKQLKKLYPDPEQDQSDALLWKKVKCQRLKELTRPVSTTPGRSQILFKFTQTTIKFEKHKKRLSIF